MNFHKIVILSVNDQNRRAKQGCTGHKIVKLIETRQSEHVDS